MGHYFQKWGTIFFSPGIRFGAAISEGAQFHPVWDYIILYVKRGGVAVGPLGPPIVSGPRCQTGCAHNTGCGCTHNTGKGLVKLYPAPV